MPATPAVLSAEQLRELDCRGLPASRLQPEQAQAQVRALPRWRLHEGAIERDYGFADFHRTMAFVNAVAWVAHGADHHPDLQLGYRHCLARLSTHSVGGLTLKDFACAARFDALYAQQPGDDKA